MSTLVHTGEKLASTQTRPKIGRLIAFRFIALGFILWAIGICCLHALANAGLLLPAYAPLIVIAYLPAIWCCLRLIGRLCGTWSILSATALTCAPALILDSLAFTFTPTLYGIEPVVQRTAAAGLLWFCGIALAWAFTREQVI